MMRFASILTLTLCLVAQTAARADVQITGSGTFNSAAIPTDPIQCSAERPGHFPSMSTSPVPTDDSTTPRAGLQCYVFTQRIAGC